jgi:hypothetical protein
MCWKEFKCSRVELEGGGLAGRANSCEAKRESIARWATDTPLVARRVFGGREALPKGERLDPGVK